MAGEFVAWADGAGGPWGTPAPCPVAGFNCYLAPAVAR
jgi:hypothetical protein